MPTTNLALTNDYAAGSTLPSAQINSFADYLEALFFGVASITHDDTANYTPTAASTRKPLLTIGGALTANRNMVLETVNGAHYWIYNNTTGGFTVTVKTSAGTGVAIAAGKVAFVRGDGTNLVNMLSGAVTTGAFTIGGDLDHDGSNVGFYGVAPAARPAALTQTFATADRTHAAFTSTTVAAADAVAAPAGGTGTAAGGWDTAANRDLAITTINALVTLANELKADYNLLRADVDDLKQFVNSVVDDLQLLGLEQ